MSSNPGLDAEWMDGKYRRGRKLVSEWDRLMRERFGWTDEQIRRWEKSTQAYLKSLGERAERYIDHMRQDDEEPQSASEPS